MAELKDSGLRRGWETGAIREGECGKGRCDLLPLGILADYLKNPILRHIEDYIRFANTQSLWNAFTDFNHCANQGVYTALLEVAKHYEDGAKKYADRNWENGMPLHILIDSAVRHYLKYLRGDVDEPHDRAFTWNMLGAIWTHENKPEMIDLPFATAEDAERGGT